MARPLTINGFAYAELAALTPAEQADLCGDDLPPFLLVENRVPVAPEIRPAAPRPARNPHKPRYDRPKSMGPDTLAFLAEQERAQKAAERADKKAKKDARTEKARILRAVREAARAAKGQIVTEPDRSAPERNRT